MEKVEDRAPVENTPEPPIITLDEKGESFHPLLESTFCKDSLWVQLAVLSAVF